MLPCWQEVLASTALAVTYVASLYVWDSSKGRDHPNTIMKRTISVAVMTFVSPLFLYAMVSPTSYEQYGYPPPEGQFSLLTVMGLRTEGLLAAIVLPLALTATLFTGPILYYLCCTSAQDLCDVQGMWDAVKSPLWLRNQLVAPFSEEWTFRACLLPLLLQCCAPRVGLCVGPLFFGMAHFHHVIERLRAREPVRDVILRAAFQCVFTSVFGMYSSYIFMKTGHFTAAFLTHAFCNQLGLPDLGWLEDRGGGRTGLGRVGHGAVHVLGVVLWVMLVPVVLQPCWYSTVVLYL